MLTGSQIIEEVRTGRITIAPFDEKHVGPNSYDVCLSPILYRITDTLLDFRKPCSYEELTIPSNGLVLHRGECYLGVTVEWTNTPFHSPMYEGRSTVGRYFLTTHVTAGFGDVGFAGRWTLEMIPGRNVVVYPHMRIGQLCFHKPYGHVSTYEGNYRNDINETPRPTPPKPGNF